MITIYLNDQLSTLDVSCSVTELLQHKNYQQQHMAVSINNRIITKQAYATTQLREGDKIDIIIPMQGG